MQNNKLINLLEVVNVPSTIILRFEKGHASLILIKLAVLRLMFHDKLEDPSQSP
jgi:hypothetical protein